MIASKKSGSLKLNVNGKMFQTTLTDSISSYVFNEEQNIEINSTVVPQSYVCFIYNFIKNILFIIY